jgi:hypothetical protein
MDFFFESIILTMRIIPQSPASPIFFIILDSTIKICLIMHNICFQDPFVLGADYPIRREGDSNPNAQSKFSPRR